MDESSILRVNGPFGKIGSVIIFVVVAGGFYFFHADKASKYKKNATKFLVQEFNKWGNRKPSQLKSIVPSDFPLPRQDWFQMQLTWYKIDNVKVTWYTINKRYSHSRRTKYTITADVEYKVEDENGREYQYKMRYSLTPHGEGKWLVHKK